jgi:hypothetical protein
VRIPRPALPAPRVRSLFWGGGAEAQEPKNYRLKQNLATGYAAFEPLREGQHDDLLFTVCLGVWAWERGTHKEEYISWPSEVLFEGLAT